MTQQSPPRAARSPHAPVPFWRDIRVIQIFLQIVFVVLVVVFFYTLLNNLVTGLERSRLAIDFGILTRPFGTQISEGQMDFNPGQSSNLQALWAGVKNTLRVVIVGLAGATVLGVLAGIGRLATNALLRGVSAVYIEIFRNTPLLVQLYFIYRGLRLVLPETLRDSIELPGSIFINRRAINYPLVQGTEDAPIFWAALAIGVLIAAGLWIWRLRLQERTSARGVCSIRCRPCWCLARRDGLIAGRPSASSRATGLLHRRSREYGADLG